MNEGFTRFVEGKIMQSIQTQEHGGDIQKGIAYKEFMAIGMSINIYLEKSPCIMFLILWSFLGFMIDND